MSRIRRTRLTSSRRPSWWRRRCGWIAEWQRARASGDGAAARRAEDALRSSHGWRVLRDLDRAGDWSEVFWEYADEVAAGTVRAGYVPALGCR
ncbi:hypothetical protein AB0877_05400 [Micromonospora sp. NPDC047644]|uniref:hypothetical protein n=1 Tax=Micromonospora sp. NPDC047644 TaxID=3157203 RepID=UPI00345220DD